MAFSAAARLWAILYKGVIGGVWRCRYALGQDDHCVPPGLHSFTNVTTSRRRRVAQPLFQESAEITVLASSSHPTRAACNVSRDANGLEDQTKKK